MKLRLVLGKLALFAAIPCLATTAGMAQGYGNNEHHDDHHQGPGDNHNGPNFQFHDNDRGQFQSHYQKDARKWQHNSHRAHFSRGQQYAPGTRFQAVPSSYYRNAAPLPSGYRYGYSNGYVVAYNPTTRIIADVLDMVTGN